ncbi:MAG: hypothetical protein ACXAEL_01385 [Candidatus Hodarchaeales archaeon]|jgi:DNA modification methylase
MDSEDWDWNGAKTRYLTFGLHDYPARMIPQISERLIKRYLLRNGFTDNNLLVVDPFCGSGSVLAQARLLNLNAYGNDVNPLAKLISDVHATPINLIPFQDGLERFQRTLEEIIDSIDEKEKRKTPIHEFPNNRHWFKDYVLKDLSLLRTAILAQKNPEINKFLSFCFSITQFVVSNVDRGSSRFIRILKPEALARHKPNVFEAFEKTRQLAAKRVIAFTKKINSGNSTKITLGDARKLDLGEESADIVVTSPPYGEERNTICYARWSKLSHYWLGYERDYILDQAALALGTKSPAEIQSPSKTALLVLEKVAQTDLKRALQSVTFFEDYRKSLHEIARILPPKRYACIVIGNRSIKRNIVDMNAVTIELARQAGFEHLRTYFRTIPRKLIASITPTGATINKENIIILQKKN